MFKKLKEKLKSWFEKAEEKAEAEKEKEEVVKEKVKKKKVGGKKEKKKLEIKEKEIKGEGGGAVEEKEEKKKGFLFKLKRKFKITEDYFEEIFSDLEFVLLENNVALEVVEKIKESLKNELVDEEIEKKEVEEKIKDALKSSIEEIIKEPFDLIEKIKNKEGPFVIIFFGINGSGKTTTIARLAYLLKKNNLSCVLAASDTFRAASIEQLEKHAKNLDVRIVKSQYNADPASVAFDAIKHAESKGVDVVLIDTAGRMYTKSDLLKEMEKICRVSQPDLKIFVAESITGNDAVEQARTFDEAVGIDGIILTKTDVDEKGGTALSISYVTGKPILYLGTGQDYGDLEKFNKKKLIENLGL